jgi:hypothetical protein
MTSPQPGTFELESYAHLTALVADAYMVSKTIPFPLPRTLDLTVPADWQISDGCIALTEGMALYGS